MVGVQHLLPISADNLGMLVGSGVHKFEVPQAEEATEARPSGTQTVGERETSFSFFIHFFFISELVV